MHDNYIDADDIPQLLRRPNNPWRQLDLKRIYQQLKEQNIDDNEWLDEIIKSYDNQYIISASN